MSNLAELRKRMMAQAEARPEPKWGPERRRAIILAMMSERHYMRARFDVIRFTRSDRGAQNMNHFFDRIATEADMQHVEQLLGIR